MTTPKIQSVRGMNDILPDEAEFWDMFEETIRSWLKSYGYRPIRLPIVEPTPLFKRAIGEVTDIVEKEMYSFVDSLNGEALTLRPEGASITGKVFAVPPGITPAEGAGSLIG